MRYYIQIMDEPRCSECERLWTRYFYVLKELSRALLAAELSGNRLGLSDMEDSRVFVRNALREHTLTHIEEAQHKK